MLILLFVGEKHIQIFIKLFFNLFVGGGFYGGGNYGGSYSGGNSTSNGNSKSPDWWSQS